MESEARSQPDAFAPSAARALDAAARALLPVLLHRVNNSTQVLVGVDELLRIGRASEFSPDLARISSDVHEVGWLFGVLAAGLGADTLVERVERDGLASVARWATLAVRRTERELEWTGAVGLQLIAPPRLAPRAAFALAFACVRAAECVQPGVSLRAEVARRDGRWELVLSARLDDDAAAWLSAFEGTELARTPNATTWRVPAAWFAAREPNAGAES
ncbi:MAG: hypothetical protein IT453_04465 [Planctomycetes bacterium]|nr:hypothetical protein [Planctomycetota bacterium]